MQMHIAHELRMAFRTLRRAPGFALTTGLILALGIGLSTAVFTVANAIMFRELPVVAEDRVVTLWGETRDGRFTNFPLDLDDVREFERRSRTVEHVAFFGFRGATPAPIRFGDQVSQLGLGLVSGNFFDVLGSRAALGRALHPEDDVAGAAPVLVLSHPAWQRYFAGDSGIVGRSVTMMYSGQAYTIVGVMPRGLELPRGTDVWAPVIAYASAGGFLDMISYDLLGRLALGASIDEARAELTRFFQRPESHAAVRDLRGVVHTLSDIILGNTRPAIILVMLAAGLLVVITCVNVANLLLVRALARVKELAVRSAMGASRTRLVMQVLAECALLAVVGGTGGVALGIAAVRGFTALAPASVPRLAEVGLDGTAVLAAFAITFATLLLSGIVPALFASRVKAYDALRSGMRNTGGHGVRNLAEGLVVAQIALATVSLTAAGLVARSMMKLQQADMSFDSSQLVVADLAMRLDLLQGTERQQVAIQAVVQAVQAMPTVVDVSPVLAVPFSASAGVIDGRLNLPGQSGADAAKNPVLNMEVAAPNYFSMLGIPLVRGRAFEAGDRDGSQPVIVVSSSVARHFWGSEDPVDKRLAMPGREFTVVGVVADTRYRDLFVPRPTVYFPVAQSPFPVSTSTLLIRTTASAPDITSTLRRTVAASEPAISVMRAASLRSLLQEPQSHVRLNAIVLAVFAVAAVTLAAVGLFAIIATFVRRRTREIGIRMALGATTTHVHGMIMLRGFVLAATGAAIGIAGAVALRGVLAALLFDVTPTDSVTLVLVAGLMIFVAAVACAVPARASARIAPAIALRSDS
jgi:putative ABC transport system permease protein